MPLNPLAYKGTNIMLPGRSEVALGAPVGCVFALVGVLVGLGCAVGQNMALLNTWSYCEGGTARPIVTDQFPAGGTYVWLGAFILRIVLYGAIFVLGGRAGITLFRPRTEAGRVAAWVAAGLVLCGMAFAVDFSSCVQMTPGTFIPARCPGGRPSWWS